MLSNSFKIIFALLYIPLAFEILFRVMAPVPMMPRYVVATPYGIRGNKPNMSYEHSTAEYKIKIQTNSKGIRAEKEIQYEKPENIKRIVLLGDSFGMGYGVNLDQMFSTRMAHYLEAKSGKIIEIVNLSTSGHGNAEELITLQNEGFKYKPDLVLLAWHNTDLDDNVRSNLYEVSEGQLKRKADSYLPAVKEREFLNRFLIYRFLAENSQTYNFLRNWAGKNAKEWLAKARFKKKRQPQNNSEKSDTTTKREFKCNLMMAILKQMDTECRLNNSNFLILDIPLRLSRKEFKSIFPLECDGEQVEFNIVSPIEKFKTRSGEQIYWERGDGHFTPLGCDLVGEVLADFIDNRKLLDTLKQ